MRTVVINSDSTLIQLRDNSDRSVAQIKVDQKDINEVALGLLEKGMSKEFAEKVRDMITGHA